MNIKNISLSNFRNYNRKTFDFSDKTTVIVGDNASGKTNILEAISLLSTGKSFRARVETEMIKYDSEISRVSALVDSEQWTVNSDAKPNTEHRTPNTKLEVVLTRGEITLGEDPGKVQKVPRKRLLVNGVGRRLFNFAGNLKVVLFGPWDLDLVTESPSIRRRYLDFVLSQVDREYQRAILSYEKGLRQRNKLLYRIREEGLPRSQLIFWNNLLIKNGDYVSRKRRELIEFISSTKDFNSQDYSLVYDMSSISASRLEQYAKEEVAVATTLVGPHRDDFCFMLKKNKQQTSNNKKARELDRYGSRGEQRMGVLWLKLAELSFIKEKTGESPVLLLDDIFSELDHEHRDIVVEMTKGQQTIITTADPHYINNLKVDTMRI